MVLSTQFDKALLLASEMHRAQTMKATEIPYMAHILGVAGITALYGGTEVQIIAAILHDTVEDTDLTLKTINENFGPEVSSTVKACTDTDQQPKPEWRQRKKDHIAAMRSASDSARFVYAADKLQNARAMLKDYRAIGEKLWERFNGRKEGTFWYYDQLIEVFQETNTRKDLVDELVRTVNELRGLVCPKSGADHH